MTELLAPSTSLRPAIGHAQDLGIRRVIARLPHAEAATELVKAGAAPTSLGIVAEVDRVVGAIGVILVLLLGAGYLLAGWLVL